MTTSSLSGKPDDYESRKSWSNKDWFTHVGAWENEHGQLCFGSSIAFCAMMQQFHRTHTQHIPDLLEAAVQARSVLCTVLAETSDETARAVLTHKIEALSKAIARAKGEQK